MLSKIAYYFRMTKRFMLCHYFNRFPRQLDGDIIDLHRDQEKLFTERLKDADSGMSETSFSDKAKLRMDHVVNPPRLCLEIGSESGWFGRLIRDKYPGSKYIGIDFRLEVAKANSESGRLMVCGDGAALPIKNSSVDLFLALHVLEHIRDMKRFRLELDRVLKENARILFAVPLGYDEDPCHRWHFMTGLGWRRFIRENLNLTVIKEHVDRTIPSEYISTWRKS